METDSAKAVEDNGAQANSAEAASGPRCTRGLGWPRELLGYIVVAVTKATKTDASAESRYQGSIVVILSTDGKKC